MLEHVTQAKKQITKYAGPPKAKKVVASPNQTEIHNRLSPSNKNLARFSFDGMRPHYNSCKPAQFKAFYDPPIQKNPLQTVTQRLAWETTRGLGAQAVTPPGGADGLAQDPRPIRHNLQGEHRHIVFNGNQIGLPARQGMANDNIGYHCAGGMLSPIRGTGGLFSEGNLGAHSRRRQLTNNAGEDASLVTSINNVGAAGRFGTYNLITCNCQDWVDAVIADYNATGAPAVPLGRRGMIAAFHTP